jgi:hypothetical protein
MEGETGQILVARMRSSQTGAVEVRLHRVWETLHKDIQISASLCAKALSVC